MLWACLVSAARELQRVEVSLTEKTEIVSGSKGDAPMKEHLRPLQVSQSVSQGDSRGGLRARVNQPVSESAVR